MTHTVSSEHASKIMGWLRDRGGIAVWPSVNLSNPGAGWTTPAKNADGTPATKPSWEAGNDPVIITDPAQVLVAVDKEVKRFHVGVRMGSQGMSYKVTDGGSRKIRKAVAAAGDGAYHVFDYETQEAVIMAPERTVPILEWTCTHPRVYPNGNCVDCGVFATATPGLAEGHTVIPRGQR